MTKFGKEKENENNTEYIFKVIVVGDIGCGKTSIVRRYVHNSFSSNYKSSVGVDFAMKDVKWDENKVIRLQLWDIAGQERFMDMTRIYYKDSVGALVVFDVTRLPTYESVIKWKSDIDVKVRMPDDSPIPVVLLANKCDMDKKEGPINNPKEMDCFSEEHGFSGWFETSASMNINIDESIKFLLKKIFESNNITDTTIIDDEDIINIDEESERIDINTTSYSGCCSK